MDGKNYFQRGGEITKGRPLTRSTSRAGATRRDAFTYNTRSELVSATLGSNEFSYAFDSIGNRSSVSESGAESVYLTNALNQYDSITRGGSTSVSLRYDADGNATQIETSTGTWNITYNAENRPIRFENAATQTVVECGYDSQGRRFEKKVTVSGATQRDAKGVFG